MSSDQSRANSAVSRGGTGAVGTPANSTSQPRDGRGEFASGRRDKPELARGADKEGIMDKITRISDHGVGKDTSSKATTLSERFGFDRRGDNNSILGKASEVKDDAKAMFTKGSGPTSSSSAAPGIPTTQDRRRRSSLMSGREMTNDFLSNYSYEIKSENGEPDGMERAFDKDRRSRDPALAPKY